MEKFLGAAGLVLVLVAVVLGFRGIAVDGVDCGAVFAPATGMIKPMACDDPLHFRQSLVLVTFVAGLVAIIVSVTTTVLRERRDPS